MVTVIMILIKKSKENVVRIIALIESTTHVITAVSSTVRAALPRTKKLTKHAWAGLPLPTQTGGSASSSPHLPKKSINIIIVVIICGMHYCHYH